MAILVTRPQPDNARTAQALCDRGFEVLAAPMLRFERLPGAVAPERDTAAVIVTSSSALRALAGQQLADTLLQLPLFAVGERTAEAARDIGFRQVVSAGGDAAALRDLLMATVEARALTPGCTLLYLAGADLARDLSRELSAAGFHVVTQTVYRMAAVAALPDDVTAALAAGTVEAVLHYSRRSARAFFRAAGQDGVEIAALAIPHYCLSNAIAAIAHEAGASQVIAAASPDEDALFAALNRTVAPLSR